MSASKILKGEQYQHEFEFSQEEVNAFAELTGDKNPVHIDKAYAEKTMFKTPIMHGFLGGSIISKVSGTLVPGEGTIYLSQNMKFIRPMLPGRKYRCEIEVTAVDETKNRGHLNTTIVDAETGKTCLAGTAELMHKERF